MDRICVHTFLRTLSHVRFKLRTIDYQSNLFHSESNRGRTFIKQRMHSSRMRTARSSSHRGGGLHRVPPGAGTPPDQAPPRTRTHTRGQTHGCKHITLPQTSFAGGNDKLSTISIRKDEHEMEYTHIFIINQYLSSFCHCKTMSLFCKANQQYSL